MQTFSRVFLSQFHAFLAVVFILFFASCSDSSISKKLKIDCSDNYDFNQLKTTKDTRGNFEMKIPSNWKKEMFVNENETRLYFADTTRELNKTFIIDIGLYFSKVKIDTDFMNSKKIQIEEGQNIELEKLSKINYKDTDGYVVQTKSSELNLNKTGIEIYLNNKNDSYYILKIDAYGMENIESRICEALNLLEYFQIN